MVKQKHLSRKRTNDSSYLRSFRIGNNPNGPSSHRRSRPANFNIDKTKFTFSSPLNHMYTR